MATASPRPAGCPPGASQSPLSPSMGEIRERVSQPQAGSHSQRNPGAGRPQFSLHRNGGSQRVADVSHRLTFPLGCPQAARARYSLSKGWREIKTLARVAANG